MDEKIFNEGYTAFDEGKHNPYLRGSREARFFAIGFIKARLDFNNRIKRMKHGRR
jgi:hypothetical protein